MTSAPAPRPPSATRRRSGLGCLGRLTLAGLVALLALYAFALPGLVEWELGARLRATGLADCSFEVRAATWRSVDVGGVCVGTEGRLLAEDVRVDFRPCDLWRGRVARVEVIGARWEVRLDGGALDLGLPALRLREGGDEAALRIDRVDLRASTLVLRAAGRSWRVPVEGSLVRGASGGLVAELELQTPLAPVHVEALLPDLGADGPTEVSIHPSSSSDARLDVRGGLADGALARVSSAEGTWSSWNATIDGTVSGLEWIAAGRRLATKRLHVNADVAGTGRGGVEGVDLSLQAEALELAGLPPADVSLTAAYGRSASWLELALSGGGFRLEDARIDLSGDALDAQARDRRVALRARALAAEELLTAVLGPRASPRGPARLSLDGALTLAPGGAQADSLRARLERLDVELESLELAPAARHAPVARVAGRLRLAGELGPERVALELLPPTRLDVACAAEGARPPFAGASVVLRGGPAGEAAGDVSFAPRTPLRTLALRLPDVLLEVDGVALDGPLAAEDVSVAVPLAVEVSEQSVRCALAGGAAIRGASLRVVQGGRAWSAPRWELTASGDGEARWSLTDGGLETRGEVALELARPVAAASGDGRLELSALRVEAALGEGWSAWRRPALWASLEVGRLTLAAGALELAGVVLDSPLVGRAGAAHPGDGRLAARSVTCRGVELAGPSVALRACADGSLALEGAWALDAGEPLAIRGTVDLDRRAGELSLDGTVRLVEGAPLQRLLSDVAPVQVEADAGVRGRARLADGAVRATLDVSARGARVESADAKRSLDGVELDAALEWRDGPRSVGAQRIAWSSGSLGELALGPGQARFTLEGPGSLLVQGVEVRTAGDSRFWVQGFRLGRPAQPVELQVFCQDVDLAEWLAFAAAGRATGEGRLNGRLSLALRPGRTPFVALGEGYLASLGSGWIAIDDAETVRALLSSDPRKPKAPGKQTPSGVERLIGALRRLRTSSLVFRLLPEAGDLTLEAHVVGEGVEVPQPIDWKVNLRGFGSLLELLLDLDLGAIGR